jgi:hypothetical protein
MFLVELANQLVADGVGILTQPGRTIFLTQKADIPTGPGPYIVIKATGGSGSRRVQNNVTTADAEYPTAQVLIKALDSQAAFTKARQALDSLQKIRNQTLDGTFYESVIPLSPPGELKLDDNKRAQVAFNVIATKRPS